MNYSSIPLRMSVVFAASGDRNSVPAASTTDTLAGGNASYDVGFPPITRVALSAGGKPPKGEDFNGVFYDSFLRHQWYQAGGGYPFDATFATAISGYPKGSRIPNSTLTGHWLNTTDANSNNPENTNGSLTGWIPSDDYGITSLTGLSNTSITLTALQASKGRITFSGALTSNINVIFPAWLKSWVIINNCTGNFTVTCKTISGSGVAIPIGTTAFIYGDGTNITLTNPLMVTAATNNNHAVNLGQLPSLLSTKPYQKFPSGLIIQGGTFSGTVSASGSNGIYENSSILVTFSTSFTNTNYIVVCSANDVGGSELQETAWVLGKSLSQVNLGLSCRLSGASMSGNFIAIGY